MKPTEFKTKSGKIFDLSIDYAIAKAIDDDDFSEITDVPICFIDQSSVEMFQELNKNSSLVFAIIWTIIQDQVLANNYYLPDGSIPLPEELKDEKPQPLSTLFLKDLDGTSIQQAKAAFKEGLYDFFPQMRIYLSELERVKETLLKEITEKHSTVVEAIIQNSERIVREELEKIDDQDLLEILDNTKESDGQKSMV